MESGPSCRLVKELFTKALKALCRTNFNFALHHAQFGNTNKATEFIKAFHGQNLEIQNTIEYKDYSKKFFFNYLTARKSKIIV